MEDRGEREHVMRIRRIRDQEAENWAKLLPCAHIVPFLGTVEETHPVGGREYLFIGFTMPFAELGDLAKHLKPPNSLKLSGLKETVRFLMSIASAIKFAHDVNVAHCDIKADNVLLFRDGTVLDPRIMDFGMSLSSDFDSTSGGTPEYMPPERFVSGRTFTVDSLKAADVYSLSVLFYEIIVGARPFQAELMTVTGRYDAYKALHCQEAPNLSLVEKATTSAIRDLVGKMLAKEPKQRPSAFRVVRELQSQEEYSIVTQTNLQDGFSIVLKDTYRWNPKTHALLGNSLHYYFLGGPASTGDKDWLENNLQQNKIYGYSFYRVLGGVNYILRVWLKSTYEHQMDKILAQFQMQYGATFTSFHCKHPDAIELFQPCRKQLTCTSGSEVLQSIAECSSEEAAKELKALLKRGLVISQLNLPQTPKIRFFITIKSSDRIGEWQRESLADHFAHELRPRVKHLSVYKREGDYCLLLKFRVDVFGRLKGVIDALLACCSKARTERIIASFSTFVEVDERGVIESDDGSIVREASALYQKTTDH